MKEGDARQTVDQGAKLITAPDLGETRAALELRLAHLVETGPAAPPQLRAAIRHALLGPSKRVRPLMLSLIATGSASPSPAVDSGCAVEMVHTASLILDDLPCMDDAKTRRQLPTTHVVYGEATAILAAIALLNRAFGILASLDGISPPVRAQLAEILSHAIGWDGLVAGQELDIRGTAGDDREEVERLNWLKTGVLFVAAAEMGAVLRGLDHAATGAVKRFATHLGHAFQTADDLLDLTATSAEIGKDARQDEGKTNIVSLLGVDGARLSCRQHLAQADAALVESGLDPAPIRSLVSRYFCKFMPDSR